MIDKHSPMAQRHVVLTFILATSTLISANQSFESDHSSHLRSASRQLMSLASFHDPATIVRKGEQCTLINNLGVKVLAQPGVEPATMRAQVASQTLLDQLHLDIHTNRPIWTSGIIAELDKIVASGGSISCSHYPHSAEDVGFAVQKIGLDMKHSKVGVVSSISSSISPWVEHVLRSQGASHVITINYNEPIVCSGIEWIESKSVTSFGDEVGTYDLLVSFSGIEHSGLGRYGDPINQNGDLESMQQMYRALAPGGYLLLAVPTADRNYVEGGNAHRIYGPDRLAQMLEHFEFIGRVWDGQVFGGWEDVDSTPRLFTTSHEIFPAPFWQFQNVLILRKPMHEPEPKVEHPVPYVFNPKNFEGKSYQDVEGLQDDGTYLLFHDEFHHGPDAWRCSSMVEEQDKIERVHYHFSMCKLFDDMFGNRLGLIYGMKMIAYAMRKPFSFTCGMAEGESPLGSSYFMQLDSNLPGPIPNRGGKEYTAGDYCHICHGPFCSWNSENLDFAADAIIADWKYLASPEVVPISDYDDAVIHLRLGDGLYSTIGDNEGKGVFPHATYINLLKQAEEEKGSITSIGIVTAPFKGTKVRVFDKGFTSLSEMIAIDLIQALHTAFPNAQVRLHNSRDDTIISSLARLVRASKVAVCGCSTFCPYATLATDGIGYIYNPHAVTDAKNPAGHQNDWVRNAASWHDNFRLFDTPMLNGLMISNVKTGDSMPEDSVIQWLREQDPSVGNIDITKAPMFR